MGKLRLMTIVGTRPEIIRLSEVIKKCDLFFDQTLVHTGQNYDRNLNQIFFEDLKLREPDIYLDAAKDADNLGEAIGNIIAKSYALLSEKKPDALLVLGDTNSCLSAIAAKRLHIPIFHMEAGNRCFDECLPEETNRRIVDHIADVNLCYSEHARRYLNAEGTAKERTFVTGSPMAEVLRAHLEAIKSSDILTREGLKEKNYFLLSAHRLIKHDRRTFTSPRTAKKTSTRRKTSLPFSPQSTRWQTPTTCRCCIPVTRARKSGLRKAGLHCTKTCACMSP